MEDFLKNKSIGKTIQNADFFTALMKLFISRPENRRPSFVNLFCSNSIRQAVISGVLLLAGYAERSLLNHQSQPCC